MTTNGSDGATRRVDTSHHYGWAGQAPQPPHGQPPVFQPQTQAPIPPPAVYPAASTEQQYSPPPAPAPAVAAGNGGPVVARDRNAVVFANPYIAYGEPVTRVEFRRPLAKDVAKHGNPIKPVFGSSPDGREILLDVEIKWDVVVALIPALSRPPLPPSTVDQLEWEDLDACAGVICGFFMKTAG